MASNAGDEAGPENFKALGSWLNKFKKAKGIVSRKITKYVPPSFQQKQADLFTAAAEHVYNVNELIDKFGHNRVLNSDQSGMKYEFHSGRTLRTKGKW